MVWEIEIVVGKALSLGCSLLPIAYLYLEGSGSRDVSLEARRSIALKDPPSVTHPQCPVSARQAPQPFRIAPPCGDQVCQLYLYVDWRA